MRRLTKKYVTDLSYQVIGAAIEVQKSLGPGLLESVYECCFIHELEIRGIKTKTQQLVPINYKGKTLDARLRCDVIVEDCIVVELKSALRMNPIFDAQVMTYARLLELPKSILINFMSENIFYEGQKTFVNKFFKALPDE